MRQAAFRGAITASVLAMVAACQPVGSGSGQIGLRMQFPQQGFQVKTIPDGTRSVQVSIAGDGLASPRTATLTPGQPSLLLEVPSGPKTITALAMDQAGKQLGRGSAQVTVVTQSKVTAVVTLQPDPAVGPSPSASPSPTPRVETSPTAGPTRAPTPVPTSVPTPVPTPDPTVPPNSGSLATPTPTPTPAQPDVEGQINIHTAPVGVQDL